LYNTQYTRFCSDCRINLQIFFFEKKTVEKDISLLIIIVIRANFVCTITVTRVVLQKKYSNIFISILLKEIAKIWSKNCFVRFLFRTIISRNRVKFIIWFLKSISIIILQNNSVFYARNQRSERVFCYREIRDNNNFFISFIF